MSSKNTTIKQLRLEQYQYHYALYPYLKNWKKGPYTFLKAILYMEAGALLVYFLLKTKIKPNTLSITYGLLGLAGGILLAISTKETVLIAIFIFFFKGILDWGDGHLARTRGETSVTGSILDQYGGVLGALGFQMGLGFYVAQKSGMILFYYLVALIPLLYTGRLHAYAFFMLFRERITSEKIKEYGKENVLDAPTKPNSKKTDADFVDEYPKAYKLIRNFLDDRARTIDFVCSILLLEIFTDIFISWIIFLGFLIKQFLIFCVSFYIIAKENWAEKQLKNKLKEISKAYER